MRISHRALQATPNDANALALQSIIAVAQGDKAAALRRRPACRTAGARIRRRPRSHSRTRSRRDSTLRARAPACRRPSSSSRRTRWRGRGSPRSSRHSAKVERALEAAQKATELQPNLSRTQTVLGFAYLIQVRTTEAREAFEKAITLDQADPLPRLGLGLAKIRDGNLDEGGRDIEVAASLDSSNAIVRSYLGKTYYEEKLSPRSTSANTTSRSSSIPTIRRRTSTTRSRSRRPTGRSRRCKTSKRRSSSTTTAPFTDRGCCSTPTSRRAARAWPHLHRSRLPGARPRRRLEIGQHRPEQLLGASLPRGLVLGVAAP